MAGAARVGSPAAVAAAPVPNRRACDTLRQVDITCELHTRSAPAADHEAENRALVVLARQMATSPHRLLEALADCALMLCGAQSAGISLLERHDGAELFRWRAVAGRWAKFVEGTMPRGSSPCGTVLDRDAAVLLARPERHYPVPAALSPSIAEVLLVPFHVAGQPVGTIWVIAHDESVKFHAEDARRISNITAFAASAYQALDSLASLRLSEQRYRALVHASANSVWRMSGDGKSMLELKSEVAVPHVEESGPTADWLRTYIPPGEHARLQADWAAAVSRREFYEHEHQAIAANGGIRHWVSRAVPLVGPHGEVCEWIGASSDITDRKQAEEQLHSALHTLEAKVVARTADLTAANRRLRVEVQERRRAEQACHDAAARLTDAAEAQRGRISRDLHDQVGQQLTALSLRLHAIQRALGEPARSALDVLQRDIDAITRATHDLALELRPSVLDRLGLAAALESYVEDWARRTGMAAELHQASLPGRLPDQLEITIYRVVQESLNNAAKHSRARQANVVLERRGGWIVIMVEDDGEGFDAAGALRAPPAGRLGLVGMVERATLLGGRVEIESEPGKGCSVYCHLPLPVASGDSRRPQPGEAAE